MNNSVNLDVRGLEHPLPLELAVKNLKELKEDHVLIMTHHREPYPLYELASSMGFTYEVEHQNNDVIIRFYR